MLYNDENKILMYKWRKENKEKYNEIARKGAAKYRAENREKIKEKELNRYYVKKFYDVNIEIKRLTNLYKIYE
jgi:hypothetical protein